MKPKCIFVSEHDFLGTINDFVDLGYSVKFNPDIVLVLELEDGQLVCITSSCHNPYEIEMDRSLNIVKFYEYKYYRSREACSD